VSNRVRRINCTVLARELWVDHFLSNDEPNCQITTLALEPSEPSTVKRIQFGFCHRDWVEKINEVEGYSLYKLFDSCVAGDQVIIEYLAIGAEPGVLAYMGGHTAGRGPVMGLDSRGSGAWLSVQNLTQGWVIDLRE
jgi:hypothetical protein